MEIRCPTCKKLNAHKSTCLRCGTDLEVLIAVRSASQYYLEKSRKYILAQHVEKALACARQAWRLEHTCQAARQAFIACLLLSQYDQATAWYPLTKQI